MKYLLLLWALLFLNKVSADELTVFAYPAPVVIDWHSPMSLAWTTVLNQLTVDPELKAIHSIGHMNFHLHCDPSTELVDGADIETGQTSSNDSEMNHDLLKYNYGMGAIITNYSGKWEDRKDIEDDLDVRYQRGSVAYLHFKIRASSCARVVRYLDEYKALRLDQIYSGLEDHAREGHGSGCSSFTESVLEVAGLMTPEWNSSWSQTKNIPNDLIGGPTTGVNVPFGKLLISRQAKNWGSAQDSFQIHFWDPYLVYEWIQSAHQSRMKLTGLTYETSYRVQSVGVEINALQVATPTDPFWQVTSK